MKTLRAFLATALCIYGVLGNGVNGTNQAIADPISSRNEVQVDKEKSPVSDKKSGDQSSEDGWGEDSRAEDSWTEDTWGEQSTVSQWHGFVESGLGARYRDDPLFDTRATLMDTRLRLETEKYVNTLSFQFKADAYYDGVEKSFNGDLREFSLSFPLGDKTDIKLGRQVQTWGTGDLVFLNDLFPKDFVSFFSGRDDEYLKAPSNALRLNHYAKWINIDVVWMPEFEPDRYLTGERFSFFSPLVGNNIAPDPPLDADEPRAKLNNGEVALRLFKNIQGREYAMYAYRGFFKQPNALNNNFEPAFAPLSVYGASARFAAGPGLWSQELAYYDARTDRSGQNPLLPNSQIRFLNAYEWEALPRFTVGLQYYFEWTLKHRRLLDNSPTPQLEPEEVRHLITQRLSYRTGRDKFTWSLFTFYSPSDKDAHLRPYVTYRHSDAWQLTVGGNVFFGDKEFTFFSQLEEASNVYLRARYNF